MRFFFLLLYFVAGTSVAAQFVLVSEFDDSLSLYQQEILGGIGHKTEVTLPEGVPGSAVDSQIRLAFSRIKVEFQETDRGLRDLLLKAFVPQNFSDASSQNFDMAMSALGGREDVDYILLVKKAKVGSEEVLGVGVLTNPGFYGYFSKSLVFCALSLDLRDARNGKLLAHSQGESVESIPALYTDSQPVVAAAMAAKAIPALNRVIAKAVGDAAKQMSAYIK